MGDGGTPDGVLKADTTHIAAVGAAAALMEQTLRSALDSVTREIEELTSNGWTGDAADAYRETWAQCAGDGRRVLDTLSSLAASVSSAATAYDEAEDATADSVASNV